MLRFVELHSFAAKICLTVETTVKSFATTVAASRARGTVSSRRFSAEQRSVAPKSNSRHPSFLIILRADLNESNSEGSFEVLYGGQNEEDQR